MKNFVYLFAKFIGFFVYNLFFLIEVKGKENFPKKGGFIVASNHLSYLDPPTIGYVCPRKLYYFAKSSLFKIKGFSLLIKLLGAIPIEREGSISLTLRKGLEILKKGQGIVIFPEGTRSKNGLIKEGKPGIGFLAIKSRVPIIPVRLIGTDKILPVDRKFIRLGKIKVIIGKPLYFIEQDYKEVAKKVMEEIKKLK
ncbi:MAG: 1-acyl-sn-glycerol-3-phosphate acyltransferase [Candidatus Omnitrophica bacterium]|nr:1-acyl-sn-glycerol-3-phosphate acyltransferase [Candidatus Omnitrophota bacterium]MCM8806382.1 1-acyl-sn-glycerol-3-phosphate acyltransferase [Candidatus Omnitrophota bacterium]